MRDTLTIELGESSIHVYTVLILNETLNSVLTIPGVNSCEINQGHFSVEIDTSTVDYDTAAVEVLRHTLIQLGCSYEARIVPRHKNQRQRLDKLVELVTQQLTNTSPRNPVAPFAATKNDVKPGVELLCVSYDQYANTHQVTVGQLIDTTTLPSSPYIEARDSSRIYTLADMGILPYHTKLGTWNDTRLTIVNTPENRHALVAWLCERQTWVAAEAARLIVSEYKNDFVTVEAVVVEGAHTLHVTLNI